MTQETFGRDLAAAVDAIKRGPGADLNTFTVGFCMGGNLSLWAGTQELGLTGAIAFYASLSRTMGAVTPALDFAPRITVPVLGLFGGADQGIPVEQVHELEEKLNAAGIPNEIVIYPGAPHSFFDRKAEEFAGASADAWTRVQGFIAGFQPATV
jgi:carboxymethylenebutenolidase